MSCGHGNRRQRADPRHDDDLTDRRGDRAVSLAADGVMEGEARASDALDGDLESRDVAETQRDS